MEPSGDGDTVLGHRGILGSAATSLRRADALTAMQEIRGGCVGKPELAGGRFDREAISRYVRSKAAPVELEYRGSAVIMIPDPKSEAIERGIVFLDAQGMERTDLRLVDYLPPELLLNRMAA